MTIFTPKRIAVTDPATGATTVYPSKLATCKNLSIQMSSLQNFLKRAVVSRGRFSGYVFQEIK
jgi:hypothetical protein